MKTSILLALLSAGSTVYGVSIPKRATGCKSDNCLNALIGTGSNQGTTRPVIAKSDCSKFMTETVVLAPPAVTTTVGSGRSNNKRSGSAVAYTTSTILNSVIPTYASACASAAQFSSACSCAGVTGTTITSTASASTVTVTSSSSIFSVSQVPLSSLAPTTTVIGPQATPTQLATQTAVAIPLIVNPTLDDISAAPAKQGLYAMANKDGSYFYSYVTFNANNGDTLVSIEDFASFISTVTCGNNAIGIEFVSADAYNQAKSSWPSSFTLMTSGAQYCASGSARAFFKVSSTDFTGQSVSLAVTSVDMTVAIGTIDTEYGTISNGTTSSKSRMKRSIIGDLWNAIVDNDISLSDSKSTTITLDSTLFGDDYGFVLAKDDFNVQANLYCPNCGLTGEVKLAGGFSVSFLHNALLRWPANFKPVPTPSTTMQHRLR